jgi:tetratricopeptide (TPR) repeat protein
MGGLILSRKKQGVCLKEKLEGRNIYSLEELCYYLYHNIYGLNESFFDEAFFDFLQQMEQEKLAARLHMDLLAGKNYLLLAADILSSVDYYSAEEKKQIQAEFQQILNRTPAENKKARADILKESGKNTEAMAEYRELLEHGKLDMTDELHADIMNNIGVIHAENFRYREALQCFEQALDIHDSREYLDNMICALIMAERGLGQMDTEELGKRKKELLFKYHIDESVVVKYTEVILQEEKNIALSRETIEWKEMISAEGKNMEKYYENVNRIISAWTQEYKSYEMERQIK